ncbi:PilC/PilY family type IV pilus protein [Ralstonia sp. CHL-2022]|uniref:PilC/PilY family type IV pilus protein n=1 Tax=Ralstonia mojiangensis TaxID=2953895 RepID=A0AAE3I105_9RALS|nr:PilC/PilY family type IV pilus protein [Ralstonia mojiangensis]MCT7315586.1 PilC/PilY family type IV pilus protein [Ralstonia mojiangensis]
MRPIAQRLACATTATLAFALAAFQPASAEDIDLYTGLQQNAGKPNVVIIFDDGSNSDANATFTCSAKGLTVANPSKSSGAEQCALYGAAQSIAKNPSLLGNVNLGLMLFDPKSPGGLFTFPSANPRSAQTLQLMDNNGVNSLLSYIQNQFPADLTGGNNVQTAGAMQEAWAFYSGYNPTLKKMVGLSGTQYTSPINNPCQRNFVIYIGNATNSGHPAESDSQMLAALQAAAPTPSTAQTTQISINSKYASNWGDEWARYMYQSDLQGTANTANPQNVITYAITVTDGKNQDYVTFDNSMATNGGGKAYTVQLGDVAGLQDALLSILNEIQAVNSVFASVSLPAAVNAQGQFLNQVYIGMFRPDATAAPRWMGNLKQYQVGFDTNGTLQLLDSVGKAALSNAGTGFMSPSAISFWTADPPLSFGSSGYGSSISNWPTKGFWQNSPSSKGWAFDSPDGEIVEKGGAGEMLRALFLTSQTSRTLLTCNGKGTCPTSTAMPTFDTANTWLTGTSGLNTINSYNSTNGAPTIASSEQTNFINWVRGRDVYALDNSKVAGQEAETGPGSPVTIRPSIHGDVLHSRPVVINYGGSTGIVVFYGANDGVFHAINGNQTTGINGVRPGGELWGFIPPEFIGKLSRLYANSPQVKLSTTPSGITPTPTMRDDFFDGSTTVMQDQRVSGSPRTIIYLTARRGGSLIYALDVTDPVNPRYLWSRSNTDISELGQTWSKPRLMRVAGYANPVLIMGAGYDASSEDSDPAPGTDTMGRGIIVLDAYSGAPVWSALPNCTGVAGVCVKNTGLTRSIASDVTTVDRTGSGYIQMAYVGDVGGNIWRVDFQSASGNTPANWALTQFASLGGAANTNNARKFFYAPDVVPTAGFNAVMAGTGDREHPLYSASTTSGTAYNVVNRFYMLKDPNLGPVPAGWVPLTEANLVDSSSTAYSGTGSGFFVTLPNPGEKVVNAPLTVAGYTTFGTNTPAVPSAGACYPNLGIARTYSVSFLTGAGQNPNRSVVLDGGGFPPSSVYGVVLVNNGNGGTTPVPVCFGCGNQTGTGGGGSALAPVQVTPKGLGKRKRTFWFSDTDKH